MTAKDPVLLYCSLLYNRKDESIHSVLPQERADYLEREVKRFDRFPREARLTLVSKLLGYLIQHVRNPHIERVHPTWVAEILNDEASRLVALILSGMSPDYKKSVVIHMRSLPDQEIPFVQPAVKECISHVFQSCFPSMGAPWGDTQLSVETLYLLKEEELLVVLKHVGLREMASAVAIAGKGALTALIRRLPADLQQDFIEAVKIAKADSSEKQRLATKRMSQYDLGSMPMEEAALKVGLTAMGGTLRSEPEIARKVAFRLPRKFGMILLDAVSRSEESESVEGGKEELMETIAALIEGGKIDKKYVDSLFTSAAKARPSGISKESLS